GPPNARRFCEWRGGGGLFCSWFFLKRILRRLESGNAVGAFCRKTRLPRRNAWDCWFSATDACPPRPFRPPHRFPFLYAARAGGRWWRIKPDLPPIFHLPPPISCKFNGVEVVEDKALFCDERS